MEDLYIQWCRKKENTIIKDPNHLSHRLVQMIPQHWSRTTWLRDSFVPPAIRLVNS